MSDHWQAYFTYIEEDPASIIFDHGIADELDTYVGDILLMLILDIREPDEKGFPGDEELDHLNKIDFELFSTAMTADASYVGRVLGRGQARYYFYLPSDSAEAVRLLREVMERNDLFPREKMESDPEKKAYRDFLYPNELEWQVIKNEYVLEELAEHGDDFEQPRRIDHWCFFPSSESRKRYRDWLIDEGFEIVSEESLEGTGDPDFPHEIQFHHHCAPSPPHIHEVTVKLCKQARDLNGSYDGWETSFPEAEENSTVSQNRED
jgi:uncharacterized protein (TIGR01619 family)